MLTALMRFSIKTNDLHLVNTIPDAELEHSPDCTLSFRWVAATSSLLSFRSPKSFLSKLISSSFCAKMGYSSIYLAGWSLFVHTALPSNNEDFLSHCWWKRSSSNLYDWFPPIVYQFKLNVWDFFILYNKINKSSEKLFSYTFLWNFEY